MGPLSTSNSACISRWLAHIRGGPFSPVVESHTLLTLELDRALMDDALQPYGTVRVDPHFAGKGARRGSGFGLRCHM
jgi:hypothetical protein